MLNIIDWIAFIILIYFALLWVGYFVFLLATFRTVISKFKESQVNHIMTSLDLVSLPSISIIIPAFNEAKRIVNAITAILNSDYKKVNLIVVNDGSTDSTLQLLMDHYCLKKIPPAFRQNIQTGQVHAYYQSSSVPNVMVIDKEHSPYLDSAADCINAGLNICRTPIFVTVDADTILEPTALSNMLFMFLTNPHCIAVGGDIYVPDTAKMVDGQVIETNIPSNVILGVQVCEYLRSFLYGREGMSILGGSLCHPGAFTMLETQVVRDAGAYDSNNFSYDAEIIMNLHQLMRKNKFPYSIVYAPSAIAWSEQPATLRQFWNQRNRWQRGLLRCLSLHKKMLFNPKYGVVGLLGFPFYVLFEIFGSVVEAISYILFVLALCFGSMYLPILVWFICLAWGYMMAITMACVVLSIVTYNKYYRKMDIVRIFVLTTLDTFFYRQWRAFCALSSSIHYVINRIRGKPL